MSFIQRPAIADSRNKARFESLVPSALLIAAWIVSGCSSGSTKITPPPSQPGPQTYMAPFIVGDSGQSGSQGYAVFAYQIDDVAQTFSKSTYYTGEVGGQLQQGTRTYDAGTTTALARGLLSFGLDYTFSNGNITTYNPPQAGGWAVELPNQAGGLVQIAGEPIEPIVAATSCPNLKSPQTYQFLTLPAPFPSGLSEPYSWDPTQETVFGSVDVSSSGGTVTFNNIQQYALPSFPDLTPGAPAVAVTSPQTGTCSSGYYGNTTVVPGNLTVTDPGPNSVAQPVALVGIGPTGLLIESNAANGEPDSPPYDTPPLYQNLLGAGSGAIGLPKPSSALDTSAVVGAQYLGFTYGTGLYGFGGGSSTCGSGSSGWSTCVASFGFAALPAGCQSVATQTATMIYGGDFPGNNPGSPGTQSNGGFGNCDLAIDLGAQDPNNNGLYPDATVYVGTVYAGNALGANYSFPAVAIAGQLGGKYAIFLTGLDITGSPNQAWGIYLLQSN